MVTPLATIVSVCKYEIADTEKKETNPENTEYHSQAHIALQRARRFIFTFTCVSIPTFEKSNLFLLSSVQILIEWDSRSWWFFR